MNNIITSDVIPSIFDNLSVEIVDDAFNLQRLATNIHRVNQHWWKFDEHGSPIRNKGEAIALMHSELSEALEGVRKNLMDEHLPNFTSEVVEMADCIIRILDYCAGFDLPISSALFAKMRYNARREDHKLAHRNTEHGKKF